MKTCISDSALADHIKSALHQNSQLNDSDIHISVDEGWVSLDGRVGRETDRRVVQSCVEDILGVFGITNNLTFSRQLSKKPVSVS
ncbi:BON domain-containing protein [Dyadobacter luticola]|nr:BON domain-containing protein [Dyadobacter luticola]